MPRFQHRDEAQAPLRATNAANQGHPLGGGEDSFAFHTGNEPIQPTRQRPAWRPARRARNLTQDGNPEISSLQPQADGVSEIGGTTMNGGATDSVVDMVSNLPTDPSAEPHGIGNRASVPTLEH
eukprot:6616619-Prymnesium_polylepis.1